MAEFERYTSAGKVAPRSEAESEKVHEMTLAMLAKKGIAAERVTYDDYASCAAIAAEVVASGKTTTADQLAVAALHGSADEPDAVTTRVLGKFACDGRFMGTLDIDEQEFLEAAVEAEQEREKSLAAEVHREARDQLTARTRIAAEAATNCPDCGNDLLDCTC